MSRLLKGRRSHRATTGGDDRTPALPVVQHSAIFEPLEARALLSGDFGFGWHSDGGFIPPAFDLDNAGDTLATALDVGVLREPRQFPGVVGGLDLDDFYRFTLNHAGTLRATLSGLTGDADLELIRDINADDDIDLGETISTSINFGTKTDRLTGLLEAGTYYARVTPIDDEPVQYVLTLDFTETLPRLSAGDRYEPDNSRGLATELTHRVQQTHSLHTGFDVDWFTFTLQRPSDVTLTTNGRRGDTELRLFDEHGKKLGLDDNSGRDSFSKLIQRLDAGTYFVRVNEAGMDESIDRYTLGLTAKALNVRIDPDGNADRARDLGFLHGTRRFRDTLGGRDFDRQDFYRFAVTDESFVRLDFDPTSFMRAGLFTAGGDMVRPVATDIDPTGRTPDQAAYLIDPGIYFVRVRDVRTVASTFGEPSDSTFDNQPGTTLLSDLPLVGPLFESRAAKLERYELSILVRPAIVVQNDEIFD